MTPIRDHRLRQLILGNGRYLKLPSESDLGKYTELMLQDLQKDYKTRDIKIYKEEDWKGIKTKQATAWLFSLDERDHACGLIELIRPLDVKVSHILSPKKQKIADRDASKKIIKLPGLTPPKSRKQLEAEEAINDGLWAIVKGEMNLKNTMLFYGGDEKNITEALDVLRKHDTDDGLQQARMKAKFVRSSYQRLVAAGEIDGTKLWMPRTKKYYNEEMSEDMQQGEAAFSGHRLYIWNQQNQWEGVEG